MPWLLNLNRDFTNQSHLGLGILVSGSFPSPPFFTFLEMDVEQLEEIADLKNALISNSGRKHKPC